MDCEANPEECEAPDADRDGDGVPDLEDSCPDIPNCEAFDTDGDGIADACDHSLDITGQTVVTQAGTAQELIEKVNAANAMDPGDLMIIQLTNDIVITDCFEDSGNALPVIERNISLRPAGNQPMKITKAPEARACRLAEIAGSAEHGATRMDLSVLEIVINEGDDPQMGVFPDEGGVFKVQEYGALLVRDVKIDGGRANARGGMAMVEAGGTIGLDGADVRGFDAGTGVGLFLESHIASQFEHLANESFCRVGGLDFDGTIPAQGVFSFSQVERSRFRDLNVTDPDGVCAIKYAATEVQGFRLDVSNSSFEDASETGCGGVQIEADGTRMQLRANYGMGPVEILGDGLDQNGEIITIMDTMEQSLVISQRAEVAGTGGKVRPEAACESTANITSLGWNASNDTSCNFVQATDLQGVDLMMAFDAARGVRTPQPGSPLIDHGPATVIMLPGDPWPSLPCGWRDVTGLGRPQDGDGDGQFECDIGAVEVQGTGAIEAGHSGVFYNTDRSGEGQYIEILDNGSALVYTFSYRPDGSGPAWFVGIADVVGNSLVTRSLIRPVGTSFGDAFDAASVWRAPAGGMSVVFPDCSATDQTGNIAYSGSGALGFQPLITRADRLVHVTGCGPQANPSPNVGLSGSFYDPARSGEGLIIQWLPNGQVLAILFTFDLAGNQMWAFGTGMAEGKSVTIQAVYPTAFATWGEDFDPADVTLQPWGTFDLEWADCDHLAFAYASIVNGYGSAERSYQRLTKLAETNCPVF